MTTSSDDSDLKRALVALEELRSLIRERDNKFHFKLAEAEAEIERLRAERDVWVNGFVAEVYPDKQAEIECLRQLVAQRGARMQLMRQWLMEWAGLKRLTDAYPEAADWFDADGVPQ